MDDLLPWDEGVRWEPCWPQPEWWAGAPQRTCTWCWPPCSLVQFTLLREVWTGTGSISDILSQCLSCQHLGLRRTLREMLTPPQPTLDWEVLYWAEGVYHGDTCGCWRHWGVGRGRGGEGGQLVSFELLREQGDWWWCQVILLADLLINDLLWLLINNYWLSITVWITPAAAPPLLLPPARQRPQHSPVITRRINLMIWCLL